LPVTDSRSQAGGSEAVEQQQQQQQQQREGAEVVQQSVSVARVHALLTRR
jgi:hypothetical protein